MRTSLKKKLICVAMCTVLCGGIIVTAACSGVRNKINLAEDEGIEVTSNGGFAVATEKYVYYVNGTEDNTADNTYGDVEKGAIMRISRSDLSACNYENVETVVPQIFYTGNYYSGLYVYDGYLYYCTPSTDRNSDGDILNDNLEFKSTKLDGSESMRGRYYKSSNTSIDYRYVKSNNEDDDDVYLMYVADEDFYKTGSSATNIHSYNTATGEDTVLAYNIDSYMFDAGDPENPVVYYTMDVTDKIGGGDLENPQSYNQVYRAEAGMTEAQVYDFSYIDTEDDDYDENDPIYVNCGDLVFDGIGRMSGELYATQFNYLGENSEDYRDEYGNYIIDNADYTYDLINYRDGILYYGRTSAINETEMMFTLKDGEGSDFLEKISVRKTEDGEEWNSSEDGKWRTEWDAIGANVPASDAFMVLGEAGMAYEYIEKDGEMWCVIDDNNRLALTPVRDGRLETSSSYTITKDASEGSPTYYGIDGNYLYYYFTGDNDAVLYRVDYTGEPDDYKYLSTGPQDEISEYDSVKIMDLEFNSSWFGLEFIDDQVFFLSEIENMGDYGYVEVCDLRNDAGEPMNNAEMQERDDLFDSIFEDIDDIDEDDYENLPGALKYLFYTGDVDYMEEITDHWVEYQDKKETYLFSKESKELFYAYYRAENVEGDAAEWANFAKKYADYSKEVNGEIVYANSAKYYHNLLGVMTEGDEEDYLDAERAEYWPDDAEDTRTWWDKRSTAERVWFIIGMVLCGLVVLAGIGIGVYFIVRHHKRKVAALEEKEERRKRTPRVDMSDDRNVDVYGQDNEASPNGDAAVSGDESEGDRSDAVKEYSVVAGEQTEAEESVTGEKADDVPSYEDEVESDIEKK